MANIRYRSPPSTPQEAANNNNNNNNNNMTYHAMRSRNADGSATVYHVHDGVMNNIPGHNQQQHNGLQYASGGGGGGGSGGIVIGGGGGRRCGSTNNAYGEHQQQSSGMSTPLSPSYNNHQPNVIYISNPRCSDDDDESDDEPPKRTSPRSSTKKKSKKEIPRCSRTSPACIATSILLALSFVVGYVFLIEAVVKSRAPAERGGGGRYDAARLRSAAAPAAAEDAAARATGEGGQQQYAYPPAMVQQPQYYVLQPVENPYPTKRERQKQNQQQGGLKPLPRNFPQQSSSMSSSGLPSLKHLKRLDHEDETDGPVRRQLRRK